MYLLVKVSYKDQTWWDVEFFRTFPANRWVDNSGRLKEIFTNQRGKYG